ncbi:MAG TPA: hypothetical protein DIT04_08995 [Dysgonomonas sp.]|nr:hypothetical protein [Dysgonomonas sp.]
MMTKKILSAFLIALFVFTGTLSAQISMQNITPAVNIRIAYINSTEILELIPGKAEATKAIKELNEKYKDELTTMQNDYNNKYTDFLSKQNSLAESIKLRRMQELYELEQNITRFMKIAQEDVESQEKQLIAPLRNKLKEAVEQVGLEQGYTCIYDKANPAIAFITPNAIDATPYVKAKLNIRK